MDERTSLLLKIINEKCIEGSYKVLTIDELISELPQEIKADHDLVKLMITSLSGESYISVKFDKDDEFCISPTPKGREYFEKMQEKEHDDSCRKRDYLNYLFIFLSVFAGVFLASFLYDVIGGLC